MSARAYELVADIAKGGMGRVELVVRRERSFARVYAMKRLHADLANDATVVAMFLEEARIAGLIRHPNVVPVLDVGQDEQGPFLVMEYVEGVAAYAPVVAARKKDAQLPIGLCIEIVRQAAHGLAAAHELVGAGGAHVSVVHRDVSPQNILLGFDGLVRVTDFGVARALDRRAEEEGVLIGKMGYMPPEQLARKSLDARADLFSLGVVFQELLTCERLYTGERAEVMRRVREEPAPDVRLLRPDVPSAIAALLLELLAKDPAARPSTARVLAERLDAIVAGLRWKDEEVGLAAYLALHFADERKRQRALVASALERTNTELPLDDRATGDRALRRAPTREEGDTMPLAAAPATPVPTVVPPPRSRLPLVILVVVGLVLALGLALALRSAPPSTVTATCDAVACRASGAAFFCEADRCVSIVSSVCPEISPADAASDASAILIGTIFDRSSPNQIARERAARLAVDGIDHAGGIDGRRVALVHCDSAIAGAVAAADRLALAGVSAIIGPSTSSEAEAVFSSHEADGVLVISPSATAMQLSDIDRGAPGLLWRTAPPDGFQSTVVLGELARANERSLVVVRRSNDVYAQSLSVLVQQGASAAGIRVDPSQVFADPDAIATAAAAAATADAVFFVSSQVADAAAFLDATAAISAYDDVTIYFSDVAANDDLVALTTVGASRFARVRLTRPAPPSTIITSELASEYAAAYGGESLLDHSFAAHTYDATALAILGTGYALGAGDVTGTRIAEGIRLVSAGTHEIPLLGSNLPAIIAAMRAPSPDVNVVGASGALDFDATTEELTRATYQVLGIEGTPPHLVVTRTVEAP